MGPDGAAEAADELVPLLLLQAASSKAAATATTPSLPWNRVIDLSTSTSRLSPAGFGKGLPNAAILGGIKGNCYNDAITFLSSEPEAVTMEKPRKHSSAVTIHDVAAAAGVSIATVSRAINGSRPMSESLRHTVLEVAESLGYEVNLLGRGLRLQRTFSVGLVVPDLENPFFSALAQQLSRSFAESGIDVLIHSADNNIEFEHRAIISFLGRRVDALILIPCHELDSRESVSLAHKSVLTIQFDRYVRGVKTLFVGCDNRNGMRQVMDHLQNEVDLVRQPPFFIGARADSSTARDRLQVFKKSLPEGQLFLGSFSFDWGRKAAYQIVDQNILSGTIVAAADVIALGVIAGVIDRGLRVPDDFRIIGFDDLGVSFLAHPALTSVKQPVEEMTRAILDLVQQSDWVNDRFSYSRKYFKPELIVRESSPLRSLTQPDIG